MRNNYIIRCLVKNEGIFDFRFNCTRTQVDKVFNALAFAAFGSNIDSCILYQRSKAPRNVAVFDNVIELNRFVVKSVEVG